MFTCCGPRKSRAEEKVKKLVSRLNENCYTVNEHVIHQIKIALVAFSEESKTDDCGTHIKEAFKRLAEVNTNKSCKILDEKDVFVSGKLTWRTQWKKIEKHVKNKKKIEKNDPGINFQTLNDLTQLSLEFEDITKYMTRKKVTTARREISKLFLELFINLPNSSENGANISEQTPFHRPVNESKTALNTQNDEDIAMNITEGDGEAIQSTSTTVSESPTFKVSRSLEQTLSHRPEKLNSESDILNKTIEQQNEVEATSNNVENRSLYKKQNVPQIFQSTEDGEKLLNKTIADLAEHGRKHTIQRILDMPERDTNCQDGQSKNFVNGELNSMQRKSESFECLDESKELDQLQEEETKVKHDDGVSFIQGAKQQQLEEPLDLQHYFDKFNPDEIGVPKESVEFMQIIREQAQTFEDKVKCYRGTVNSLEYFVIDENLMQLLEVVDRVKSDNSAIIDEKLRTIYYIKSLQQQLDSNTIKG